MQRVYQKIAREDKEGPMEEKVIKVDDTISKLQAQVEELQLKINIDTPLEERER